jgi:branched-subunit amino acid aminotransferase/4-amino-4-deoxychorismate lyase
MTRDDIIRWARQHGKPVQEQNAEVEYLFTLEGINALLAAEREACAKVCEELARQLAKEGVEPVYPGDAYAAAIRARGET